MKCITPGCENDARRRTQVGGAAPTYCSACYQARRTKSKCTPGGLNVIRTCDCGKEYRVLHGERFCETCRDVTPPFNPAWYKNSISPPFLVDGIWHRRCKICGREHPWTLPHFRGTTDGNPGALCTECRRKADVKRDKRVRTTDHAGGLPPLPKGREIFFGSAGGYAVGDTLPWSSWTGWARRKAE